MLFCKIGSLFLDAEDFLSREPSVSSFAETDTFYKPLTFPRSERIRMAIQSLARLFQSQDFWHIISLYRA